MNDVLKRCELFAGLHPEDVERLGRISKRRTLPPGEYLFLLGDHADQIYVVLKGKVEVCFPFSFGGRVSDVCVESQAPGSALGWSCFVRPYRFTLSARAAEDTEVAAFPRRDLQEAFEAEPRIGYAVITRIAEMMGHRLLTMQALWARELQRAVAGSWPEAPHAGR